MKLLLITFYFPPAGGGGVQRTLKFAGHLAERGAEVHVLAPSDPHWIHSDPYLVVPEAVTVHRVPYLGPRGRRPADELYGLHGIRRLAQRGSLLPRRLIVPDENATWALTATPAALRLARRERFDAIMTSSPPSSVHLIGAAVSKKLEVPWIADLRDPIIAKEDRRLEHPFTRLKERTHIAVASLVARQAAAIVAVTPTLAAELNAMRPRGTVATIANGSDFEDFGELAYRPSDRFRITHTGSFFGRRSPRLFLRALAESRLDLVARFVGDFRPADRDWAQTLQLGNRLEIYPFVPHALALAMQRDSEALLLLLPEIGDRGKDIPSGKLFEYIAARRPILAAVPPDGAAAELIRTHELGIVVHPDDVTGIQAALETLIDRWRQRQLADTEIADQVRARFDRRTRVDELATLLESIIGRN